MRERVRNPGKTRSLFARYPIGLQAAEFPRRLVSGTINRFRDFLRLIRRLAELQSATANCEDLGEIFDEVQRSGEFRSEQKRSEILALLENLKKEPPTFLCEIGSSRGGTLFLLARVCAPNATIISVDLGLSVVRRMIYQRMGGKNQRIVCVQGDSRSARTIARVEKLLGRNRLDCLFIDGDHSLQGVMSDFITYARFVRENGAVVFHDIVADHQSSLKTDSANWTGGVPKFWSWIKTEFQTQEYIEDIDQDGYGLGIIRW